MTHGDDDAVVLHALALTAVLASPSTAVASPSFELRLDSERPATVTGVQLKIEFAGDPPLAQRQVDLILPAGSVIDGTAVATCRATDSELMLQGPAACPEASRIGEGTLELATSSPLDPFVDDAVVFNAGDALAELFTERRSGGNTAVGRRRITAPNVLSETLGSTPGLGPDGESAVKRIDLTIKPSVVTTPPTCPASGRWTSRLQYTTSDGEQHVETAETPCRRPPCRVSFPRGATAIVVRIGGRVVRRSAGRRRVRIPAGGHAVARYGDGRKVKRGCAPR